MTGALASQGVFATLINHMEANRLLGGAQFHTISHFATILSGTPDGHMAAVTLNNLLASSPDRIETVPSDVIAVLRTALPVLQRAMDVPPEASVTAFSKLQRILQLTGSNTGISQTMSVITPGAIERAREVLQVTERPRVGSPALRYLERMRGKSDDEARLPSFTLEKRPVQPSGIPALLALLGAHFGAEVTRGTLQTLFGLDLENCRIRSVDVTREASGRLRISGTICHGSEMGGYFGMIVPPKPALGTPWSVKVEAISVTKERLGIGSELLFRVALFLHEMGVHSMEANAMEGAGLFCVFNGFRVNKSLYEEIVAEFVQERTAAGESITDRLVRTRLLDRDANLAELASFEVDGWRVGREFLSGLFTRKYLPVRFELSADKQAWLRLLSNLHRNRPEALIVPLEWGTLPFSTHQMLLSGAALVGGNVLHLMDSDRDHAIHLIERINNWATSVSMVLSFPPQLYASLPEETRRVTEHNLDAIRDVLTMVAADPSSVLCSHFIDHMSPGASSGLDFSTNRSFLIARTLTDAAARGLTTIPEVFRRLFNELVNREG